MAEIPEAAIDAAAVALARFPRVGGSLNMNQAIARAALEAAAPYLAWGTAEAADEPRADGTTDFYGTWRPVSVPGHTDTGEAADG